MVINFRNLYINEVISIVENLTNNFHRKQVYDYLDVVFVSAPNGINGKGRKIPRSINGGLKKKNYF